MSALSGVAASVTGVLLAATEMEDYEVSPGITGFLVTFGLALAVIGLMFLFIRDLRKVNRAFAKRDGTSATATVLSNDRQVEASLGSSWPYADAEEAAAADRAARVQGVSGADAAAVAREQAAAARGVPTGPGSAEAVKFGAGAEPATDLLGSPGGGASAAADAASVARVATEEDERAEQDLEASREEFWGEERR